jgi:uncharacterized protein YecT (DUF1311 family)
VYRALRGGDRIEEDRMRWLELLIVVICLVLAGSARAQQSSADTACLALPAPAQAGCLEKFAKAADARLNEVYRQAMGVIETSDGGAAAAWKGELKKAQQAWIAFRDADCGALIGYEWGHGTGMGSATESCLLQKTEQRTRELVGRYIDRH